MRAAAVRSVGSTAHIAPTSRTITATLKNTWATMTAAAVPCHASGSRARNAAPTTTVGNMNGTVTNAAREPVPGQHVGRYEAHRHREGGAHHRLPQREPQHARDAGGVQRVAHGVQVQHAAEQRAERPRVEDQQHGDGQRGQRRHQPTRQPVQRSTIDVHVSCHCCRLAAIFAGSMM